MSTIASPASICRVIHTPPRSKIGPRTPNRCIRARSWFIVGVTGETGHSGGQGQPVQLPGGEPVQALEQIVRRTRVILPALMADMRFATMFADSHRAAQSTIAPPVKNAPAGCRWAPRHPEWSPEDRGSAAPPMPQKT